MNSKKIEYGLEIKNKYYLLNPDTNFTNHGSFGATPKAILDKKISYLYEMEILPDKWFRFKSFELWNKNRITLGHYLDVNPENLFFGENATESINAILKSVQFEKGDAILETQYTYGAIMYSVDYTSKYRLKEGEHIPVFKVPCTFPIKSKNEVLAEFEKLCETIVNEKKLKLRLVVIDHISSASAMIFPVKEINKIIRKWSKKSERDTIIIIDGAHSIGQTELRINDYDCDYYVSNLHKWFLAPKGCCFLYVNDYDKALKSLQPNFISWGYEKDLSFNFFFRATCDRSAWYLVEECIDFYENKLGGLSSIRKYTDELLDQAVDLLVKGWNTNEPGIPKELEAPFMRLIKLPYLKSYQVNKPEDIEKVTLKLARDILERFNVNTLIVYVQNELYCRICCFVYNTIEDYVALRDAVLNMV